ncbi:uncharacterized protein LOC141935083 [Strix uralensis]|uniref:uncharacterized protein LOC141935083 n=1 Tax=Strix uralensis TaxID=36305 RepID=UPI003DA73D85
MPADTILCSTVPVGAILCSTADAILCSIAAAELEKATDPHGICTHAGKEEALLIPRNLLEGCEPGTGLYAVSRVNGGMLLQHKMLRKSLNVRGTSSFSPDCSTDCQTHCPIDCRQGRYYTAGNCLECPTGFYCPGGQAAPRKCPLGTANELTAQADITACQVCPNGYLSLESGAGCRACPDGYSCDPRSGVQRSCHPGQYSPEGELECQECPETYICPDGQSRQRCLAGQQPNPSRTHCVTCAPGFFSTEDALLCQPCPAARDQPKAAARFHLQYINHKTWREQVKISE